MVFFAYHQLKLTKTSNVPRAPVRGLLSTDSEVVSSGHTRPTNGLIRNRQGTHFYNFPSYLPHEADIFFVRFPDPDLLDETACVSIREVFPSLEFCHRGDGHLISVR